MARKSPNSLTMKEFGELISADTFDPNAAVGFIKLWGLPTKVYSSSKNVDSDVKGRRDMSKNEVWGGRFEGTVESG